MLKKILVILFMVLFLTACQEDETIVEVNPPRFLRIVGNRITWEDIPDSEMYTLSINESDVTLDENYFMLSGLSMGTYVFKVKTKVNGVESIFSDEISHIRTYPLPIEGVRIAQNSAIWEPIGNGVTYRYEVKGETTDFTGEGDLPAIDFSDATDPIVSVTITALFEGVTISSYTTDIDLNLYHYFDETQDFEIDVELSPTKVWIDFEELTGDLYTFDSNTLIISKNYLKTLSKGLYNVHVESDMDYYFTINVLKIGKPHIVSNPEVEYQGEDLSFTFELYEGVMGGINGNGITSSDYTIEGSILTISKEYINQIILNEPNRKTIVLTYVLINGPINIYGSVFINL